jgi:signal transduction histidine kinase
MAEQDTPPTQPTDRATMARGLAFLFAAGATLVSVSLLLPHSHNTNETSLLIAIGLAYVTAAGLVRFASSIPVVGLEVVLMLGTVLITLCVIYGGDSASAYPLMYVWVALYAAYVFSVRAAAVETLFAAGACAVGFLLEDNTRAPSVHWLMGAGTVIVAGVLTASLTRRIRAQQSDLATIARMANGLADPNDFAGPTCANLRASAHADVAALFEPAADGRGMDVVALAGSRETARLFDGEPVRQAIGVAIAFARAQPLIDPGRGGRLTGSVVGHAQPIVRNGVGVGVLALGYARPRRGVPERAATAALLFATEASVAIERAERQAIARERRALDINDNIVQGLTVAKYAIGQGHVDEGVRAIDDTLRRARQLITDQLTEATAEQGGPQPGDLVRESRVEGLSADDDDASSAPVPGP